MQQKSFGQKLALILALFLGTAAVFWFGGESLGLTPGIFKGLTALSLVAMTYAILLALPPKRVEEKTFFQNIKLKIPIILIISGIIWMVAGKTGFPIWWQIEFVAFAFVGLVFFVILDMKTMSPESTTGAWVRRLLGTYAIASGLFIAITAQLPQFDPQVEVAKLERPPLKLSGLAGPEVIAAGRDVFENNKCFNCHKVFWEGNSDRGPNLGTRQIGLYSEDYIRGQILDPRRDQAPGFDDPKSKKAMPTYYEEDLSEDEISALISYLKTLRDPTHMPVEGKLGSQWSWWDDPKIIAEGKVVFEGAEPATEGLNCSVCHGKEGIPLMTGAMDFRKADNPDTEKMADRLDGVLMKDWPDELWYRRVTRGVDATPMAPWGMIFQHLYLWKAEAYARTFHDPLDKRTEKRPIPPIPTKEEIEKWKTDGMFLDPLL
ncbi:MAG: c-type cytochrome [Nitrospinota bacterium]|nr:c-type cytochrome [Nitrospinota bacterium]